MVASVMQVLEGSSASAGQMTMDLRHCSNEIILVTLS